MLELLKPMLQLLLLLIRLRLLLLDLLQLWRDDAHGGRGCAHGANGRARGARVGVRFPPRCSSSLHTLACQDEAVAATSLLIVLRALLMKLLRRAAALSQRARCGALRFPFLPLVRRLGAEVVRHRTSLRRLLLPSQYYVRPPSPSLLTPPVHHRARAATTPACSRLCRPSACAKGLRARHHPSRPFFHICTSGLARFPHSGPALLSPLLTLVFLSLPPTQVRRGDGAIHLLGLVVGGHPLSRKARLPSSCTLA